MEDVDAVAAEAVAAGGKLVRPVENKFYGDRIGTIEDPFGHRWYVTTHVEDVPPDEIARRAAALARGAHRMIPRERIPYSAIVDRPPLKLPGGARIVVWPIVNLEFWDISRPMARQVLPAPTGQVLLPDVPNWSWHEYGMRVGVWRFFDLFSRLGIRPTVSINARVCEDYPRVAAGLPRRRLGVHGPCLRAGADPPGRGPEGDDRALGRR